MATAAATARAGTGADGPVLPEPRGPLTAHLLRALRRPPHPLTGAPDPGPGRELADDDLQLALYVCYELHYRSFAGVDDGWEWEPTLLGWRRRLEAAYEARLGAMVAAPRPSGDVEADLRRVLLAGTGPSLSAHVEECGGLEHLRELAAHRSAYQLKEADPHTWAIPRLAGGAKAALVHIQRDEYGDGVDASMHSSLFAVTMRALGLDDRYGGYLDHLPGATLATVNLVSLFGLHRRWRGALVGHLAAFEMSSVVPMGRYARALERLGVGADARRFYDVHVEADAEHEVVAAGRLAGGLVGDCPELAGDVLFGAAALVAVEAAFTRHVLRSWAAGRSSLRRPLAAARGATRAVPG